MIFNRLIINELKCRIFCVLLLLFTLNLKLLAQKDSITYYTDLYKSLKSDYQFKNWNSTNDIDRCIVFFTKVKDSALLSDSYIRLSNFEASRGQYNNAFSALWKALPIAEATNDIRTQHDVHLHLARLYNVFDKNEEASVHEQTELTLAKKGVEQGVMNENSIVSAYYNFVHYNHKIRQPEKAMAYLDTCFYLAEKYKYTYDDKAYLLSERGNLLFHKGEIKEAITILEESKDNFLRINPGYLTIIYFYLGNAYEADGQMLVAKDNFQKALKNIESTNSHYDTKAEVLLRLSRILNKLGQYKEAYQRLSVSKKLNDKLFSTKSFQNEYLLSIPNVYKEQLQQKDEVIKKREQELIKQKAEVIRFQLFLIIAIAILVIGLLFWYLNYQRQKFKTEKETQLANSKLKHKKNKALVEYKNKELTSFTLRLIDKEGLINELIDTANKYAPANEHLIKSIKLKTTGRKKLWEEFDKRFIDVNKGFYQNLKKQFPDLTATELKHCALIKLNFSAKEMAQLLNISLNGVNTSRYRIRKKLQLQREDNLTSFISSI